MSWKGSVFGVIDNSTVKHVKCLNTIKGFKNKGINLGNVIPVFPKIYKRSKKIKRKKYLGVITSAGVVTLRQGEVRLWSAQNQILLLTETSRFIGTRVDGPICKEMRLKMNKAKFKKIISYASRTV